MIESLRSVALGGMALVILVSSGLAGCGRQQEPVQPTALETARIAMREAYRLPPDARFLRAIPVIDYVLTGRPKTPVETEYRDGRWKIRYRQVEIGAVREFPDFQELFDVLAKSVTVLRPASALRLAPADVDKPLAEIGTRLDRFGAVDVTAGLREIDHLWSQGMLDPRLLAAATRALALLNVQMLDRLDTGDAVSAQALALLAVTRTLGAAKAEREEALLADVLGYSAHATKVAQSLSTDDPARLYLLRDDARLKDAAERKSASVEARYFYLVRLSAPENEAAWAKWRRAFFADDGLALPVSKAALALHDFALTREVSRALPTLVAQDLARAVGAPSDIAAADRPLSAVIDRVESALKQAEAKHTGPFLDADTYRAYYQSYLYSALHAEGLHYRDALASAVAVQQFTSELGKPKDAMTAEFLRWYVHVAGITNPPALIGDFTALTHLGGSALRETFETFHRRAAFGDTQLPIAAKQLATRLDTRVANRLVFADVAYLSLLDLPLSEALYRAAVEAAPQREGVRAWVANFTGDDKTLAEMLAAVDVKLLTRVQILEFLEKRPGASSDVIRSGYERLTRENPDKWSVWQASIEYLERAKNYPEARAVVEAWLRGHGPSTGFPYIYARTALARVLEREGRYTEAWTAIAPVIASQQSGSMERGASVLDKLGRIEESEQLARAAVERYPGIARTRTRLAELYWRHEKYDDAAKVLRAGSLPGNDWTYTVGPIFAEVFASQPKERGLAALLPLLAQGFAPHLTLRALAFSTAKAGNNELAFEIASRITSPGLGGVVFLVDAYKFRKAWVGKEQALGWLRTIVPPAMIAPASMIFYEAREGELLWDLLPEMSGNDEFWLMRVAASVRAGAGTDPHRDALLAHHRGGVVDDLWRRARGLSNTLRGAPSGDHYRTIARYLLGLASEREVLAQATDDKKRCEISYYVGLKAQSEGRYADASDWYRVSVETGLSKNGEYSWSLQTLYNWESSGKSLARLAAEKR